MSEVWILLARTVGAIALGFLAMVFAAEVIDLLKKRPRP